MLRQTFTFSRFPQIDLEVFENALEQYNGIYPRERGNFEHWVEDDRKKVFYVFVAYEM